MAQNATVFKANLEIADVDRDYYRDHALTIARHPSETDERMMVRVLAFARHAHDALVFGKGLSVDDEPDLWRKDPTGAITEWIEVGQPDERRVRRACRRAEAVFVYAYGGRSTDRWWSQSRGPLEGTDNLTVVTLAPAETRSLAGLARRTMRLSCTLQEGRIWMTESEQTVAIEPVVLKASAEDAR
jgi:uncharacterized protein YaeQ